MARRILLLTILIHVLVIKSYSNKTECTCKSDLVALDDRIKKTPAYKRNKDSYRTAYSKAVKEADAVNTIFDCHILLNELLLSLHDNHSRIYGLNQGATKEIRENPKELKKFKESEIFNGYPKPNIDLDSLRASLNSKEHHEIEGIYMKEDFLTIGVYRNENENNYEAIIFDSKVDLWEAGEVMSTLTPYGNEYLLSVGGSLSSKRLIAYTERIEKGFFFFFFF